MNRKNTRVRAVVLAAGAGVSVLVAPLALSVAAHAAGDKPASTSDRGASERGSSDRGASQREHNPRGTNGTVKIDGAPLQPGMRNEPHVTCDFAIDFFNFDAGQRADIRMTAQAPSGPRSHMVLEQRDVVISDDAAGGGRPDPDATLRYGAAQLNLAGMTAHEKQGFHVRVTVAVKGERGAGKSKVFWMKDCAGTVSPPKPTATPTPTPSSSRPATPTARPTPPVTTPSATPTSPTPTATRPVAPRPSSPATRTATRPATPPTSSASPTVPAGGVDAGLGGGLGGPGGDSSAPAGTSLAALLLVGAATLGLGLTLASGRLSAFSRPRA